MQPEHRDSLDAAAYGSRLAMENELYVGDGIARETASPRSEPGGVEAKTVFGSRNSSTRDKDDTKQVSRCM